MQQIIKKIALLSLASALVASFSVSAQEKEKSKDKEKKDAEQIIIMRTGDNSDKVVIELQGDKVLVNGKDAKDGESGIVVHRNKIKDVWAYGGNGSWNGDAFRAFTTAEPNRAMLGVTTEKVDGGVEIQEITKESGAEKAGLKKGDVIKKINDTKIETPDGLSAAIRKFKPGEKVNVTYSRDKKDHTVSAELGKFKGVSVYSTAPGQFNFDMKDLNLGLQALPRARSYNFNQNWSWAGGGPRLGVSVQDTEDGKGVKVLEADEDGNGYKAGIRENDVITEVDGKSINSADEVAKIIKESKDKTSVKVKVQRNGKTETLDVKIPRKLKTADL